MMASTSVSLATPCLVMFRIEAAPCRTWVRVSSGRGVGRNFVVEVDPAVGHQRR